MTRERVKMKRKFDKLEEERSVAFQNYSDQITGTQTRIANLNKKLSDQIANYKKEHSDQMSDLYEQMKMMREQFEELRRYVSNNLGSDPIVHHGIAVIGGRIV